MKLPFDAEQFFAVFARYNKAVAPAQLVLVLAAIGVIACSVRPTRARDRLASGLLGGLWLWMGFVYHIGFFRTINPAATLFGAAFVLEGLLFLYFGMWRGRLHLRLEANERGAAAAVITAYALAVYPMLGQAAGHVYPATPTFGLPCPTTMFTLAALLVAQPHAPLRLLLIPLAWSLLGVSAAVQLGVWQDLGLVVAGLVTVVLWVRAPKQRAAPERATPASVPSAVR
jgi:hypothetical protein